MKVNVIERGCKKGIQWLTYVEKVCIVSVRLLKIENEEKTVTLGAE